MTVSAEKLQRLRLKETLETSRKRTGAEETRGEEKQEDRREYNGENEGKMKAQRRNKQRERIMSRGEEK